MSAKSPALNRDILEEIVPYFNQWNQRLHEHEHVDGLKKFMLSGKEPYEAVLRHFSHADTVIVAYSTFRIVTKRHILRRDRKCNLYKFSYDFGFLDDILGVLEKSNTKLEIEDYPKSAAGKKTLARLTQKHLKFIGFDDGDDLPADYYKFFKNECNFDNARLILCSVNKPSLSEFLELSSKHRSLTTHFIKFYYGISLTKRIFPAVESLSIDPCFCEEDFEDFPFVFTNVAVGEFSRLIIERMPNLKKLEVEFSAAPEQPEFYWKRIYKEMKNFDPEMFKHIPLQVKGKLNFFINDFRTSLKNIIEDIPKSNPGVAVDDTEKRLIKKFDIHDGLSFEFVYQLREDESEDEYESEFSFDEDDAIMLEYINMNPHQGFSDEDEGESDGSNNDEEEDDEGSDYDDGELDAANA